MRFEYFTSVVTMRIPINDNGKVGTPEILKKTTFPTKAPVSKKKQSTDITLAEEGEYTL